MGTDIHLYIEKRLDGGKWELDPGHIIDEDGDVKDVPAANRWYRLFTELANVRGTDGLFLPRGFPYDVTDVLRDEYDHTPSWLYLNEFKRALAVAMDAANARHIQVGGDKLLFYFDENRNGPIFFEIDDFEWKKEPNYVDIINYCERWIVENKDNNPEVRFIFWFDS